MKHTLKYHRANYEQTIKYIQETKLIYFIDCSCNDFRFRRIKKIGSFNDIKYYAEPCKHLQPIITLAKERGYKLKKPKKMEGTNKCSNELRNKIIKNYGGKCQICCSDAKTIHRKQRGLNGGKYNETNCVLVCDHCHKQIHSGEFK